MSVIAKKISELRKLKGLTQEELAEQSYVNLRTIQRIEKSESEPRGKTLKLICDALEVDMQDLLEGEKKTSFSNIGTQIVNGLFLVALNLVLMTIFGYLTLDSAQRNIHGIVGAFLLSFFMPFFIVFFTQHMSGLERMLKFGSGFIIYFLTGMYAWGFPKGFISGLFPCLLIATAVLYFGHVIIKDKKA